MAKKLVIILGVLAIIAVWAFAEEATEEAAEEAEVTFEYIGANKCIMCHKKDGTGPSWEKTAHATKAWEQLGEENQKNEECIVCHSTGKDAEGTLLTGIQCEACHGPGSEYKSMKVMKDLDLAVKNGLIIPSEETCMKCHDQEKIPEEYRPEEAFNYKEMIAKPEGVHAMFVEEEAEE